jgi:hypothetical protein
MNSAFIGNRFGLIEKIKCLSITVSPVLFESNMKHFIMMIFLLFIECMRYTALFQYLKQHQKSQASKQTSKNTERKEDNIRHE